MKHTSLTITIEFPEPAVAKGRSYSSIGPTVDELVGIGGIMREDRVSSASFASYLHPVSAVEASRSCRFASYLNSVLREGMDRSVEPQVGQANVNGTKLQALTFPLASEAEQAEIVQEVERRFSILDEIEAQVDANLKRAARLRQGILKRAFEGRLVPQDPTDEPAEKLLERIRQQRQPATTMYNGRMGTRRARRPRRTSDPVLPFPQDDGSGQGGKP